MGKGNGEATLGEGGSWSPKQRFSVSWLETSFRDLDVLSLNPFGDFFSLFFIFMHMNMYIMFLFAFWFFGT